MSPSSPSLTTALSRSPSPVTPSTPDDSTQVAPLPTAVDLSTWCKTLPAEPTSPSPVCWDENSPRFLNTAKEDTMNILSLDDLIQDYPYDTLSSATSMVPSNLPYTSASDSPPIVPSQSPGDVLPFSAVITVPPLLPTTPTKPVPPPAPQPRKRNPLDSQTVVYPPKESCSNIPEGGTKSRVETQVRVTVDLAHASATEGDHPSQYDRVGSWKWLRLPKGTAMKKRTRKEGKIDPLVEDTLQLAVEITCASPPHSRVACCSSCQVREAKRVARKLAQRAANATANGTTEPFNIVQFNCPEVLSFSSGTVVFPLRITCYFGFHVHFTMSDHTGRVVGTGTTHPIMITDDHKSTGANAKHSYPAEIGWSQVPGDATPSVKATSYKRKHSHTHEVTLDQGKKRLKINAFGASRGELKEMSRRSSSGSLTSPSVFTSALPTRATTPSQLASSGPPSHFCRTAPPSPPASDSFVVPKAEGSLPSPKSSVASPRSESASLDTSEMLLSTQSLSSVHPSTFLPTAPPSPVAMSVPQYQLLQEPLASAPLPFMFFPEPPSLTPVPQPRIHRLIPSSGPIIGGIEVTILGSNFHPSLQLDCLFGDVMASSTQRWSDNTLVCILPPRQTSGVVAVWFNGMQKDDDGTPPCLFTYTDESDRALMELALQVVGLKMTGRLEDAKSVAMRIVGPANEDALSGSNAPNETQHVADSISLSLRSALHHMGPWSGLEKMVIDLLSLLDVRIDTPSGASLARAMDHKTSGGQTLLHFAAFLKYPTLVSFLIEHEVDKDARDHNGHTALHLASLVGAQGCAAVLLDAGANVEIVNVEGKTAQELADFSFTDLMLEDTVEDGESQWGDGEDSGDEIVRNVALSRHASRVRRRRVDAAPSFSPEDSGHDLPAQGEEKDSGVDEKRAATFMRKLQRTLARVQPKDGIIPNMPHLALPQLCTSRACLAPVPPKGKMRSLLTPQEWRAFIEKSWLMQGATTSAQMHDEGDGEPPVAGPSMPAPERPIARKVGYDTGPTPDYREVNAFGYHPGKKHARQIQNKEDRMLMLFWIPILILALLWAFAHGVRIAMHSVRTMGPLRALLRL
ncbi:hypothetical protein BJV77DRAFT_1060383 [Russula vinacea]|nr:hypothetical protein BJV77DRAFT_1060383 [Russula vinacea]